MSAPPSHQLSKALLEIGELVTAVLEAVEGYRAQCEAKGFSPTAAEQMAMEYHHLLVGQLCGGRKG